MFLLELVTILLLGFVAYRIIFKEETIPKQRKLLFVWLFTSSVNSLFYMGILYFTQNTFELILNGLLLFSGVFVYLYLFQDVGPTNKEKSLLNKLYFPFGILFMLLALTFGFLTIFKYEPIFYQITYTIIGCCIALILIYLGYKVNYYRYHTFVSNSSKYKADTNSKKLRPNKHNFTFIWLLYLSYFLFGGFNYAPVVNINQPAPNNYIADRTLINSSSTLVAKHTYQLPNIEHYNENLINSIHMTDTHIFIDYHDYFKNDSTNENRYTDQGHLFVFNIDTEEVLELGTFTETPKYGDGEFFWREDKSSFREFEDTLYYLSTDGTYIIHNDFTITKISDISIYDGEFYVESNKLMILVTQEVERDYTYMFYELNDNQFQSTSTTYYSKSDAKHIYVDEGKIYYKDLETQNVYSDSSFTTQVSSGILGSFYNDQNFVVTRDIDFNNKESEYEIINLSTGNTDTLLVHNYANYDVKVIEQIIYFYRKDTLSQQPVLIYDSGSLEITYFKPAAIKNNIRINRIDEFRDLVFFFQDDTLHCISEKGGVFTISTLQSQTIELDIPIYEHINDIYFYITLIFVYVLYVLTNNYAYSKVFPSNLESENQSDTKDMQENNPDT